MLTDNAATKEGWEVSVTQANIVSEFLSEYNEMGVYATMHTVQTDAKLVDRQNL